MFGELALSERAIAAHGILATGAASVDASFSVGKSGNLVASGSSSISSPAINTSIGVGILTGATDTSLNFTQSGAGTRFATGISADVFSFTKETDATRFATGVSEQSFNFTQDSSGTKVSSGAMSADASFTQSTLPYMIVNSVSRNFFSFSDIITSGSILVSADALMDVNFDFVQTSGILIYRNNFNVEFAFTKSANGALLWERVNANTPSENWVPIVASGETWTPVNANGTIETWIQKVV